MPPEKLKVEVKDLSNKTQAENLKIESDFQEWYDKKLQLAHTYTGTPEQKKQQEIARNELKQYGDYMDTLEKRYENENVMLINKTTFELQTLGKDLNNKTTSSTIKNLIENKPTKSLEQLDQDVLNNIRPINVRQGYEYASINTLIKQVEYHSEMQQLMKQQNYNNTKDHNRGVVAQSPGQLQIAQKALELYARSYTQKVNAVKQSAGYTDAGLSFAINAQRKAIDELTEIMQSPEMQEIQQRREKGEAFSKKMEQLQGQYLGRGTPEYYRLKQQQCAQAQERIKQSLSAFDIDHHRAVVTRYSKQDPTNATEFTEYMNSINALKRVEQTTQQLMNSPDGKIIQLYGKYSKALNDLIENSGGSKDISQLFDTINQDNKYLSSRLDIQILQGQIANKKLKTYADNMEYLGVSKMQQDIVILSNTLQKNPEHLVPGLQILKQQQESQNIDNDDIIAVQLAN